MVFGWQTFAKPAQRLRVDTATRIESARKGESNQPDRWSCFRSGFPRVFILPENARRQSIPGARGWRSTRAEGAQGREKVAPHILLISVSIVVSVGTPSVRVARPTSERDHPSSCPPFRSRPTLPLSLAESSPPPLSTARLHSDGSVRRKDRRRGTKSRNDDSPRRFCVRACRSNKLGREFDRVGRTNVADI